MDTAGLTPLAGGWSGETFLAHAGGERTVVRIYTPGRRDDAAPEIDAALLRLVRGLVPVPEVLEVRRGAAAADQPGLLVAAHLEGERGDLVLPDLDPAGLAVLGARLGEIAADLAGMPTLRAGRFVDSALTVGDFGVPGDLPGFVAERLDAAGWPHERLASLTRLAQDAELLTGMVGRTCLVHSDLNPKNVLVDRATLTVTGVLDWEFAHSGHPFTDLGNLLRFDRHPAYVEAALRAWCRRRGGSPDPALDLARERRGGSPDPALDLARAADLWALADLAARAGDNRVADRAAALLSAIADSGDLHAVPAGWTHRGAPA